MGFKQWPMDPSRLHQLPALGYDDYKRVIQRSWVHVYWTVPFILSWSLMEAMASGCCIVASSHPRRGNDHQWRSGSTGGLL